MVRLQRPPLRVWVWAAATVALVVVATLLWRGSDAAATESTTAEPAGVPVGAPAAAVSEVWSATGNPMPEDVVESGRVLVGSEHGVRALDPRTGEEAWHYTRSNARLCDVAVTDGVAVAVFRTEDRCDEAVALDADTGVRAWTRNVSFGGDVVLDSTDSIVLAIAEGSVVTLDPNNDNIRWRYEPPERCRILGADAGDAGVALLQRCSGSPGAVQLRMLDGFTGDPRWSRDLPAPDDDDVRLLGADRVVGVEVGADIQLLAGADGTPLDTVPTADDAQMTSVGVAVLLRVDGTLHAYEPAGARQLWEVAARGLPGVPVVHKQEDGGSVLLVPEASGFVPRDALTGERRGDPAAADDVASGGLATAMGPVVVHQVDDQVVVYR
jgi:outer membrane protein assembly factor BamB